MAFFCHICITRSLVIIRATGVSPLSWMLTLKSISATCCGSYVRYRPYSCSLDGATIRGFW